MDAQKNIINVKIAAIVRTAKNAVKEQRTGQSE